MIRCVRLWSGPDGKSHFEEGAIDRVRPAWRRAERQVPYRFSLIPADQLGPKTWMASGPRATARHHAERRAGIHDTRRQLFAPRGRHTVHRGYGRRPRLEAARRATMEARVRYP
jgi:hypothetical protein